MKIDTSLDYEVILANAAQPVYFAVQFEAPALGKARPRPAAFCLVLDRSGSMQGPPLEKAKQAARLAVRNLRPEDQFSLVTFDNEAQVRVPLQPAADKDALLRAIDSIQSGGSTNLTGGWMLGRDELGKAAAEASRRLLLLSDGLLNHGIVEPERVRRIVAAGLENQRIRTSCLGFGDNYDEDLMGALAQVTNGQFYDADSPEKFPAIFESELEGLQKITVQNLRVRIRRLEFCDSVQSLGNYQSVEPGAGWTEYAIGDLISGERRVVCFALGVLPLPWLNGQPVASLQGERLLEVEVVYDEIGETEVASRTFSQVVRIQATQNPEEIRRKDEIIPWVALQRAGQAMDQVTRLMDQGEVENATQALQRAIAALKSYGQGAPVAEAIQQLEALLGRVAEGQLSARERKSARYYSQSYARMSSREHWSASEPAPSFKAPRPTPPTKPGDTNEHPESPKS